MRDRTDWMTAAQLMAPGRFEVVRAVRPRPGPKQVRVQLEGCGVCASNLPVWQGRSWFSYPLAPGQLGHEGWGSVEALGPGVDDRWQGQRVAFLSERAYAEYDVADVNDLVPLPEAGPAVAPVEPFACTFNIVERCALEQGEWTAVIGLGFIGLGVARLAVREGARVVVLSSNPTARETARDLGVDDLVALEGSDEGRIRAQAVERVMSLNHSGCGCVIECTGFQGPLDLAGDLVAEGGRLVIAGYHQDGLRHVNLQQWNWKGIDVINAHERNPERVRRGMFKAAEALARDAQWADSMITHRFSLAQVGEALDQTSERPPGFVKGAVLMPRESG